MILQAVMFPEDDPNDFGDGPQGANIEVEFEDVAGYEFQADFFVVKKLDGTCHAVKQYRVHSFKLLNI